MKNGFWKRLVCVRPAHPEDIALEAEYRPRRAELANAGLDEEVLRSMDPDDRVAVLERARPDPYDFIFLGNL